MDPYDSDDSSMDATVPSAFLATNDTPELLERDNSTNCSEDGSWPSYTWVLTADKSDVIRVRKPSTTIGSSVVRIRGGGGSRSKQTSSSSSSSSNSSSSTDEGDYAAEKATSDAIKKVFEVRLNPNTSSSESSTSESENRNRNSSAQKTEALELQLNPNTSSSEASVGDGSGDDSTGDGYGDNALPDKVLSRGTVRYEPFSNIPLLSKNPMIPFKTGGSCDEPLTLSSDDDDDDPQLVKAIGYRKTDPNYGLGSMADDDDDSQQQVVKMEEDVDNQQDGSQQIECGTSSGEPLLTPTRERTLALLGGDLRYLDSVKQSLQYTENVAETHAPAQRKTSDDGSPNGQAEDETSRDAGPPIDTTIVYFPEAFASRISEMSLEELNNSTWMTPELQHQLCMLMPQGSEIADGNGRSNSVVQANLAKMFPIGRQFASVKQLAECVTEFGDQWCFCISHSSKKFACTYGRKTSGKRPPNKNGETLKDQVDCPFFIGYNLVAYPRAARGQNGPPSLRFRCKVTSANYEHSCDLDPTGYRVAMKIAKRTLPKPTDAMPVVMLLRRTPHADNKVLRAVIRDVVPAHICLDCKYLARVRRAVFRYNLQPEQDLGSDELNVISSILNNKRTPNAVLDYSEFYADPIMKNNYTEILRKVMQESGETWDALKYLEDVAAKTSGFVFRVRRNPEGRPIGILWMTATMRRNAAMYGDVLFLDAQKRQMNASGWPYIALVVRTSEFKVGLAAESIHVEEAMDAYAWTMLTAADLEPMFKMENVHIIFGDEFLTDRLLEQVGARNAILLGDHYHLFKVVWPKYFGSDYYKIVYPYLKRMYYCKTKVQYETAYGCMMSLQAVRADPEKVSYLETINQNRKRYAGYIRQSINGHLGLMGSSSAESNHSSIVARIGPGGVFSIAEYISQLVTRASDQARANYEKASKHRQMIRHFKSAEVVPEHADMDKSAFETLSQYAYHELFRGSLEKYKVHSATHSQWDPQFVFVHPTTVNVSGMTLQEGREHPRVMVMSASGMCTCAQKVAVGMQCFHELVVTKQFLPIKWVRRWWNVHALEDIGENYTVELSESLRDVLQTQDPFDIGQDPRSTTTPASATRVDSNRNRLDLEDSAVGSPAFVLRSPMQDGFHDRTQKYHRLNFQTVFGALQELARSAQNDQKAMCAIMDVAERMTGLVREGNLCFQLVSQVPSRNVLAASAVPKPANFPVAASSRPLINPHSVRRKRSITEIAGSQHSQRKRNRLASDQIHVGTHQKNMSKSCSLCRNKGHQVNHCPRVTRWGVPALATHRNKEMARSQRAELVRNLALPSSFPTSPRTGRMATMDVYEVMPKTGVSGIVLQQRFHMNRTQDNALDAHVRFCFQCTLLTISGEEMPGYSCCLFSLDSIIAYINKRGFGLLIFNCMKPSTVYQESTEDQSKLLAMPSADEMERTDGEAFGEQSGLL